MNVSFISCIGISGVKMFEIGMCSVVDVWIIGLVYGRKFMFVVIDVM